MTKKNVTSTSDDNTEQKDNPSIHMPEWTDYVLSLLKDDEKIAGNPTTDGLRRIFEQVLACQLIETVSSVVQAPEQSNEKRATVVHTLKYYLNNDKNQIIRTASGAADVYWGNCDKIYRNHPVAVAETRAEGRALRRALRLRKVVAAEEIAKEIEDDVDGNSISKITNNQINFIDVIAKRIDIDVIKLINKLDINLQNNNIYALNYDHAVAIITKLSDLQRNVAEIDDSVKGYNPSWK